MKHLKNFNNQSFVIYDLSGSILKKINEYENKIRGSYSIKKDFHNIDFVYMHSIVLDLAKLISITKKDNSGLLQLKKISPGILKKKIEDFEKTYQNTIDKITNNRNKIIAHVDISDMGSYFNMGFSEIEINRKIEDYKRSTYCINIEDIDSKITTDLKKLKSKSSKNERYSPSDFFEEINVFKNIIKDILIIVDDLRKYFYN